MISYIFIIAITTALVYLSIKIEEKTTNKVLIYLSKIIAVLFPAIIAGIRYDVGTDYKGVYEPLFNEILSGEIISRARKFEIGYILLNKLVIFLGGNFNIVMFLASLLTIIPIYIGLLHYKDKISLPFAFFLFMIMFYQKSFNLVRQMMSVGIIFYAFIYLDFKEDKEKIEDEKYKSKYEEKCKKKNKDLANYKPRYKYSKEYKKYVAIQYLKFFLCVVASGLFQRTSFIMLIIPFIKEIYANKKFGIISIASYLILVTILLNFKSIGEILVQSENLKYYANYFKGIGKADISIAYFIRVIPVIIPFFFVRKKILQDKQMNLLYSMTVIGCILLLLGYLTSTYGERLSYYFSIFQIVMFPYYVRCLKDNKFLYISSIVLVVLFNTAIWFYDYIYLKRDETVPYKTIFSIKNSNDKDNNENMIDIKNNNELNEISILENNI